jgi:ketosteroid isomerase-like protein
VSQENVESAWRAVDSFNGALSGASEDFFELVSEDVEWAPITTLLDGVSYRGRPAVRKWVEDVRRDWEFYELKWEEVHVVDDDRVLALGGWHARGRRSGVELRFDQAAWLLHFRNGVLTSVQTFTDRNEALDAAGMSDERR